MKKIILFFCLMALPAWAAQFPEKVRQGTLMYGHLEPGERAYHRGFKLKPNADGMVVFAVGRNAKNTAIVTIKKEWHLDQDIKISIEKRDWQIDHVVGVPADKVTPPPEFYARIADEQKLLDEARNLETIRDFPVCYQWPVKGRISSPFGFQRIYNGTPLRHHSGLDIAAPIGTPIYAIADGVVQLSHEDLFYTGKTVLIEHGSGMMSGYSHMSQLLVKKDDVVKCGDVIGLIGSTGRSTGPHLHLTLSWREVRVDPELVLQDRCW